MSNLSYQKATFGTNAEPDVKWTLIDLAGSNDPDTGDIYSGFDRFRRVKDNRRPHETSLLHRAGQVASD